MALEGDTMTWKNEIRKNLMADMKEDVRYMSLSIAENIAERLETPMSMSASLKKRPNEGQIMSKIMPLIKELIEEHYEYKV